ncbi:DUF2852 domain-containing protein [Amorphus orientalis]|uniref:DUF2852 domain-containing protein n=1 Tax=Amorphus orientalis TaxID=649198 RepID=A0AAE4ASN8_9HYPH|nr:DUF2852 domain-containing protein [Amorphus orientalis]MDQ0315225.1 hypothetical protein [Amorphus orientalis]
MTSTLALRPAWTPLTVFLMVLGFIVFWPLGLAMLAYILWGDHFHRVADDARGHFKGCSRNMRKMKDTAFAAGVGGTGNVAFDEYRERELKRLEEERRKLDTMRAEFDDFLRNLRRAKDQEEFDRFMSARTNGDTSPRMEPQTDPATAPGRV